MKIIHRIVIAAMLFVGAASAQGLYTAEECAAKFGGPLGCYIDRAFGIYEARKMGASLAAEAGSADDWKPPNEMHDYYKAAQASLKDPKALQDLKDSYSLWLTVTQSAYPEPEENRSQFNRRISDNTQKLREALNRLQVD